MRTRHPYLTQLAVTLLVIVAGSPARAADVKGLAACTVTVFREIGRTRTWSGKPPGTCRATVAVTKVAGGIAVSAWATEPADAGWARTTFTAVLDYGEIASKDSLSAALQDVVDRGNHLERCLRSLKKSNDPLDCAVKGAREYLAGEETGVKDSRTIWPDNTGRHTVVEYEVGSTIATPDTPVEVEAAQPLPPGLRLDLHLRGNAASPASGSAGQ